MIYTFRDYQEKPIELAVKHLTKDKPQPIIVQMATGAGKSLVIAGVARKLDGNILVLQPSRELVAQNHEKMVSYAEDDPVDGNYDHSKVFRSEIGIYCAGLKRKEIRRITYATIQSIFRKPELFKDFHYVIIDECHQVNPENLEGMYTKFLENIGCKRVLGLTATPYRLRPYYYWEGDERRQSAKLAMINRIYPFFFKSIIYRIETDELIDQGYLAPILYRRVEMGEMSQLKLASTGQDYTYESLRQYWLNDIHMMKMAQVIQKIDQYCQRSLTFCASIEQATRAKEMLAEMGIKAEMVFGDTKPKKRAQLVADYRAGKFKHMLNVGVFTTGFDVPALDCVILARQTISLALYYQMVGRGVRLDPERPMKKLRVYDLVRVSEKLGRVETIKVVREEHGFRDKVISEVGNMTGVPLFEFAVNKKE